MILNHYMSWQNVRMRQVISSLQRQIKYAELNIVLFNSALPEDAPQKITIVIKYSNLVQFICLVFIFLLTFLM